MEVNTLIDSMLLVKDGKYIHTCNLVVLLYQGLYILTEINPWYETCRHINTDVYIGMDSLRLAENIVFKKGSTALDLCSGTGIQGMLTAKSAKKVVSVEINTKAAPVTQFNIMLNGLDDIIELRVGDLYSVLKDEKFDEDKFKDRMWKIYKDLSAKYLYSIVYEITSNCMEHSNYYLDLYNKWDIDNIPEIVSEVSFEQDNHSFRVKVQNDYIGYFDDEALEIYEEVKKGISIHDIAVNIFHKHQSDENYLVKYPGFSIGKCECIVLNSCMEMEQLGVVKSRVQ